MNGKGAGMKIKKDLISSIFKNKKRYILDGEDDENIITIFQYLLNCFSKGYFYLRINCKHKSQFLSEGIPNLTLGNDILFEFKDTSFLEKLKENLNSFHYIFIYTVATKIFDRDKSKILRTLYNSPFDISLDQDLVCDFGINDLEYSKEETAKLLSELNQI